MILTLFSYLFYGWANPAFAVVMLGTTILNFYFGLVIARYPAVSAESKTQERNQRRRKRALVASVVVSLGALVFFKYFNFAVDSVNAALVLVGAEAHQWHTLLRVTLPLGISFYTFQAMSYTIDVYQGDAKAISRFVDFACYVSMFPQLVAGPIIRFQEVADQLIHRSLSLVKFSRGVAFVSLGLTKKIFLANTCGKVADTCFDAISLHTVDAWVGAVAYSFQIYFDFSAYSDMAIGLGLMLGFVFPKNFDSPYRSQSITEFWQRWHISLSTWLRDYLYIPLGGNRKSPSRTYINLALVMLLGGLWHGAAWNFIIWGGIHGLFLGMERALGKKSFYRSLPGAIRMMITFGIATLAWVFFRAPDIHSAFDYLRSMFAISDPSHASSLVTGILYSPYSIVALTLAAAITWGAPQTWDFTRRLSVLKAALIIGLFVLSLIVMTTQSYNPFIYFIF